MGHVQRPGVYRRAAGVAVTADEDQLAQLPLTLKQRKSRPDIPDAFVWQTVLRILERHQQLNLISADSAIAAGERFPARVGVSDEWH